MPCGRSSTPKRAWPEESYRSPDARYADERVHEIAERFVDALERGDVNAVVALLVEDATFAMPPQTEFVFEPPRRSAVYHPLCGRSASAEIT